MERMSPLEFKRWLENRTRTFAVSVFRAIDELPKGASSRVIAYQLGKSASSIGANYREANRAESGDDFRHKLSIALKEASESVYWLEILVELHAEGQPFAHLCDEAGELLRLLQSISHSSCKKKSN